MSEAKPKSDLTITKIKAALEGLLQGALLCTSAAEFDAQVIFTDPKELADSTRELYDHGIRLQQILEDSPFRQLIVGDHHAKATIMKTATGYLVDFHDQFGSKCDLIYYQEPEKKIIKVNYNLSDNSIRPSTLRKMT